MATANLQQLIWQTRRLFQQLRVVSEELLEQTGINPSHRAILEYLSKDQPATVPHIARQLSVSRQHVQVIANELTALDLLKAMENPAHKRSPLLEMTAEGKLLFESIQDTEARLLAKLQRKLPKSDLATTLKTLKAFDELLISGVWRE